MKRFSMLFLAVLALAEGFRMNKILLVLLTLCAFANATILNKTVRPSGGDYVSINAAIAANTAMTQDTLYLTISDTSFSEAVKINITSGYGVAKWIVVIATGSARFNGVYSATAYTHTFAADDHSVSIATPVNMVFDGIQFTCTYANKFTNNGIWWHPGGKCTLILNSCYLGGIVSGASANINGILTGPTDDSSKIYIVNSLITGWVNGSTSTMMGINITGVQDTLFLYNSDITKCYYGVYRTAGGGVLKNSYVSSTSTSYYGLSTTSTKATCAAKDSTGCGFGADLIIVPFNNTTFTDTAAANNYTLIAGSGLLNVGTNVSGETYPKNVSVDVIGTARPKGAAYDIGLFELGVSVTYDTVWSIAGTGGTVSPASKFDTCTATFKDTATAAAHYAFSGWAARHNMLTIPAPTNRFFAGTFTDQTQSRSDTIDATFSCVAPTLIHSPAAHICTTGVAVIPWTPTLAEADSIKGRMVAGLSRNKTTGQVTGTPTGTVSIAKTGYQDTAWGCSAVYGADTITVVDTAHWCVLTATAGTGGTLTTPATGKDSALCNSGHTIVAAYTQGYRFDRWTRSSTAVTIADSTAASTTATGTGAVTANFKKVQYLLTLVSGTGTTLTPSTQTVDSAAVIQLHAMCPHWYTWVNFTKTGGGTLSSAFDSNATVWLYSASTVTSNATIKTATAPTLVYPTNGDTAISKTVTVRWHPNAADSAYTAERDTSPSFNSALLVRDTTTDTTRAFALTLDSTTYRWRVKGINNGGASAWSTAWTFKTAATSSTGGNEGLGGTIIGIGIFLGGMGAYGIFRRRR